MHEAGSVYSNPITYYHFPFEYYTSVHFGLLHIIHISLFGKSSKLSRADFFTSRGTCIFGMHTYTYLFYKTYLIIVSVFEIEVG